MKIKKNEQLIERKEIEGTPFVSIKQENQYYLTIGNYRIKVFDSEEELNAYTQPNNWELLGAFIEVIVETLKKQTK